MKKIEIHCDGSTLNNGNKNGSGLIFGGIGIVFIDETHLSEEVHISKGFSSEEFDNITNNTMEIMACLRALKYAKKHITKFPSVQALEIFSDSQYVIKGLNEWLPNWKKNNWRTAAKKPISNKELWVALDEIFTLLSSELKITLNHVYGHNGDEYNEIVDKLATKASGSKQKEYFQSLK